MGLRGGAWALLLLLLRYGIALGQNVTLTEVATAMELQTAVAQGAAHIVVIKHLDLRKVEPQFTEYDVNGTLSYQYALDVTKITRSVTGRCAEAPSRSDLAAEWVEGQCVLDLVTSGFLMARVDIVWVGHLYMKFSEPVEYVGYRDALSLEKGMLYVTNVTIEGVKSARGSSSEVDVSAALSAYAFSPDVGGSTLLAASGLLVLNFHPTGVAPIMLQADPFSTSGGRAENVQAYLLDSRISNNDVVFASSSDGGAIQVYSASVKLERVAFSNNSGNGAAADFDVYALDSTVYSDATSVTSYFSTPTIDDSAGKAVAPKPLSAAPDDFLAFDDEAFLSLRDQVEAALLIAAPSAPQAPNPLAPLAPEPSEGTSGTPGAVDEAVGPQASKSSRSSRLGTVVGAVVGLLALVACAAVAAFVWRRRRRLRSAGAAPSDLPEAAASGAALPRPQPEFVTMTEYNDTSAGFRLVPAARKKAPTRDSKGAAGVREGGRSKHEAAAAARPVPDFITMEPYSSGDVTSGISLVAAAHLRSSVPQRSTSDIAMLAVKSGNGVGTRSAVTDAYARTDTLASMRCDRPQYAKHSLDVEDLEDALEHMLASRQLLMGMWQVLGATNRRVGGQGVVQFIKDAASGEELVAKFFLDAAAFRREAELYAMSEVREMMAAVVSVQDNADGALEAPNGLVLPPFIVLERGRSLHEWALIDKPDYVTTLQVLVQIVKRLCALHACGLVHRDIKPANILWRSSKGAWTLIDFGCATPIGQETGLAFSAPYAAPEVAQAFKDNRATLEAHTAVDIWALGLVIWELFMDRRAFPGCGMDEIFDALTASAPLPWESDSEQALSMRKLGLVRRVVAECLSRDPGMRPSAEELYLSMDGVFQTVTTMQQPNRPG